MIIGIYIYDNAEVLDFAGPFEVFSTANRLADTAQPFEVILLAERKQPVIARGGLRIDPDFAIYEHPLIDILIVAGGVHTTELDKSAVIEWIAHTAESAHMVASVCTGAFLLAEAGLLAGRSATTHWEDIPDLVSTYPNVNVIRDRRWVDEDRIITSGGISAGIDMSLHLVSRLTSLDLAEKTARQMEFDWRKH